MYKYINFFCMLACTLLLIGCQTIEPIPSEDFSRIRNNLRLYENEEMRLGGKVTSVSFNSEEITFELLSIPLELGQPKLTAKPDGRFIVIAKYNQFPDEFNPLVLNGLFMTIRGRVIGPAEVNNRVGYFSTFAVKMSSYESFDFRQLALSQRLISEKNNTLEEIKAMFDVKIQELRYLQQLIAETK